MVKHGPAGVSQQDQVPLKRTLREEAQTRGLLPRSEFSGVSAHGVDRNDAAKQLMKECFARAFELLRREFGSRAHFWPRPKFPVSVDFYWRKANLAVVLTGPLHDRLNRPMSAPRARDARDLVETLAEGCSGDAKYMKVLRVPYYDVYRHPSNFLATIRAELVASGKYPKL
jgi:hypothetical protein